jgi:hypothetical protein
VSTRAPWAGGDHQARPGYTDDGRELVYLHPGGAHVRRDDGMLEPWHTEAQLWGRMYAPIRPRVPIVGVSGDFDVYGPWPTR